MNNTEKWMPLAGIGFLIVVFILSLIMPERVTAASQVILGILTAAFAFYMKIRTDFKIKSNGNGETKP